MEEIVNTLLVSCIPAVITGVVTYLTASRNAKTQIASLQESNKHEIEKLMRQHEVDIESLKEKHHLETEKSEQEHRHKVEIMEIEHRNALESKEKEQSNAAMFGVMADVIKDPSKLQGILELANNPAFKRSRGGGKLGWYEALKDGISVAQKADNLQLVRDLLEAQQQIFDLINENNQLKEEIKRLNEVVDIKENIERHKDAYITLKNDSEKLIYCSCCWDTKKALIQGQIVNTGKYQCPACKTTAYYDREAYNKSQADAISGIARGRRY